MPKATKFNVNVEEDQHVQELHAESIPPSIPNVQMSTVENPNITFFPIDVSHLRDMLPSHLFIEPEYKIVGANFTDGAFVGVVMGLGAAIVGNTESAVLYIRGDYERQHESISLKDFKKSLGQYVGTTRVVAVISNEEWATVVGLRMIKGDSRTGGKIGIVLTLGSRCRISDVRA